MGKPEETPKPKGLGLPVNYIVLVAAISLVLAIGSRSNDKAWEAYEGKHPVIQNNRRALELQKGGRSDP
jgi:hypothetical protein